MARTISPFLGSPRRAFLRGFAALPGLGALAAFPAAAAGGKQAKKMKGRDVIAELGLKPFINAAGTYTSMTASQMPEEAVAALEVAWGQYVDLVDLHDRVGERIASRLQCEAAMVSAGCASALTLATAACVTGDDREKIRRLPDVAGMKDEVVIQKGHRLGYDHAIRNCGVKLVEVETAAELDKSINSKTAMLCFINTLANDGEVKHEEFVKIAKKHSVPTLIDAAADVPPVENLWRFTKMGFDLAAYSGGKGLRGPQSAGLLLGRQDLIAAARLNNVPNGDAICRTNKVNKEELVAMLVALEVFLDQDHKAVWRSWEDKCGVIASAVKGLDGVTTEVFVPEIANAVPHLRIKWDYGKRGLRPEEAAQQLAEGEPAIRVRPGTKEADALEIAVWMMQPDDEKTVAKRVREVLNG